MLSLHCQSSERHPSYNSLPLERAKVSCENKEKNINKKLSFVAEFMPIEQGTEENPVFISDLKFG